MAHEPRICAAVARDAAAVLAVVDSVHQAEAARAAWAALAAARLLPATGPAWPPCRAVVPHG